MKVILTPEAKKQYNHLPKREQVKIKKKLVWLESDPLSGKKLSGTLKELRSMRVWPYRILYFIEHDIAWIVSILHRQGAYKGN